MLPERYLKLSNFFRTSGFSADLTSLPSRIVLQKKVYFAQAFGIELGYNFGWYVFGPYSSELTDDAFGLLGLESRINGSQTQDMSAQIERLNQFFGEINAFGPEKDERYWLELLSSLHFLTAHAAPPMNTKAECIAKLRLIKPGRFSEKHMELAWELLTKYKLVRA